MGEAGVLVIQQNDYCRKGPILTWEPFPSPFLAGLGSASHDRANASQNQYSMEVSHVS